MNVAERALSISFDKRASTLFSSSEISPSISDTAVLKFAAAQNRLLITDDKDFGDLVVRGKIPVLGVILLRTSSTTAECKFSGSWRRYAQNLIAS